MHHAHLPNPLARRLFLATHGLGDGPVGRGKGAGLLALIGQIGFVQVDSINTVARAHHMILAARSRSYRPEALRALMERDRALFEHWTHDASIIPVTDFPHWRLRFARDRARLVERWTGWQDASFVPKCDTVLAQIAAQGPVSSGDVGTDEARGKGGWWDWHPSKAALEYLWRVGEISVLRRDGFTKVYDLTERVIPPALCARTPAPEATIDWACAGALERLGFASASEIARFWNAVTPDEARQWCRAALARGEIDEVEVAMAKGHAPRRAFARPGLVARAEALAPAPGMVRILSPFDPALRDRARAERLFGFHYRIEVFVPEPKRRYGYYVFPVLEGERIIGRIDMRAVRADGVLRVRAFWPEAGLRPSRARAERLEVAVGRMARFAGCESVAYEPGWRRAPLDP